ncbi:MAG: hypothetical protein Ctma_0804 [Catillopecten margaritatus gill symbiont]|uniref:Autotransporter domain-containing protein n=1 Tax=Catillopecten margaritatus gill symbiont TaxID=3083288 RepID=A0AAU6PGF2_9GAMM
MKQTNKLLAVAISALLASSLASAETEVTGKMTYEAAGFTNSGSTIGNFGDSAVDATGGNGSNPRYGLVTNDATPSHSSDVFKSEAKAQVFFDGDVKDSTFHVEVQGVFDGKAIKTYDSVEAYTQRDPLREAYIDTEAGDWAIRAGKQQVVWGTADGAKLLDLINPTDYSEMAQNQMEDSRITTWMLNAEKDLEDGSNIQIVISQPKENIFAGLNRNIDTSVRMNGINLGTLQQDPVIDNTLNNGTDSGHAFMMKGPDTITGARNGFLNIVPDLGSVASRFAMAFTRDDATSTNDDIEVNLNNSATTINGNTVAVGADGKYNAVDAASILAFNQKIGGAGFGGLNGAAMEGFTVAGFSKMRITGARGLNNNLANAGGATWNANTDNSLAFVTPGFKKAIMDTYNGLIGGYMGAGMTNSEAKAAIVAKYGLKHTDTTGNVVDFDASTSTDLLNAGDLTGAVMLDAGFQPLYNSNLSSFSDGKKNSAVEYMTNTTFRTFDAFVNAKSQYVYNMPKDTDVDVAARFKGSRDGVNYSVNASYNYDKNPIIDLSWRGNVGQELTVHEVKTTYNANGTQNTTGYNANPVAGVQYNTTTLQVVDTANATAPGGVAAGNSSDTYYTAGTGTDNGLYGGSGGKAATLQFSQEVKRVKQIGGSFDTAIETKAFGSVVIRGEALYTKDGYSPVMNKSRLSIGGLVGALQMKKADRFKYVLGADITVLKNMLVSAQFIQDRNLDYVDDASGYTTDYATMHLSNGFQQAEKNKDFYSLFFSKPFGASGEHRWNNIFMFEENGGKWNRLDAEFSINDDTVATVEYNKYWGDENTQFGQLKNTSNIQIGLKYTF